MVKVVTNLNSMPNGDADPTELALDLDKSNGLFGILTKTGRAGADIGFVLINAGLLHRVGPFRLYVEIARSLAKAGYPTIRMDLSGKGDSDAMSGLSLAETNLVNIRTACEKLEHETGARRFVIGGLCSGADDTLQAAAKLDNLAGMLLFDGYTPKGMQYYMRRYAPRLFSPQSWRKRLLKNGQQQNGQGSPIGTLRNWGTPKEMVQRYRDAVDANTRILAIYTGWAGNHCAYPLQLTNAIKHPRAAALITERHLPNATHLMPISAHRQQAIESILEWTEGFVSSETIL